jgi:octaprenyl-diphosphate synthase
MSGVSGNERFQLLVERDPRFLDEITIKTKHYLDRTSIAIDRELERHASSRFYGPLKYALEGGKRIRPMAAMLSAESMGSKDDSILDAAVAVELLHAESIIHDDIIDQEVSRRGKAAFHVRYGYSASLLTADFVFAMILDIAARYRDKRVAHTLSKAALRMCEGEYMELTIDPMTYKLGWDEYIDIVYNKTAALFQTATELGATIGGGTNEEIEALSNYGKYLGIAYQVHDDMLDWGAKDKVTMALKQSNEESSIISRLSALTDSYAGKAKEQLSLIPDGKARRLLLELTDFSVQRDF